MVSLKVFPENLIFAQKFLIVDQKLVRKFSRKLLCLLKNGSSEIFHCIFEWENWFVLDFSRTISGALELDFNT